MPRRRMIDPDIWNDSRFKKLDYAERLFFVGMFSNADDEGRLLGDPAFLRSRIFPYDDFTLEDILKMRTRILDINPNLHLYNINGEDYLAFLKWDNYQKPDHAKPSKIPAPTDVSPTESVIQSPTESVNESVNRSGNESLVGQSSLVKSSLVKSSLDQVFFTDIFEIKDLTDRLKTTLDEFAPSGSVWLASLLNRFWKQVVGKSMSSELFDFTNTAVKEYTIPVLAKAYAKAAMYKGGKYGSVGYLKKILEEKAEQSKK